jgi:hypothetical protein
MKLIKANIPAIEAAFAASGKTDKTYSIQSCAASVCDCAPAVGKAGFAFERNGKQEKLTIGNAKVLTADEARHKAREILRDADLGRSPRAKRAEEKAKQRITFSHVAGQYLQAKQQELRPNSLRGPRTICKLSGSRWRAWRHMRLVAVILQSCSTKLPPKMAAPPLLALDQI